MALETQVGKAIIEVDYLTHAGPQRALETFNKWIKTANQWSLGVNVIIEPEFAPKPKEENNAANQSED